MTVSEDRSAPLPVNEILELLAHHHRRAMLRLLIDAADNVVSIDEMIDHLSDQEATRSGSSPGVNDVKISLHHEHLPKLGNAGLTEVDTTTEVVRYSPNQRVESCLRAIEEIEEAS